MWIILMCTIECEDNLLSFHKIDIENAIHVCVWKKKVIALEDVIPNLYFYDSDIAIVMWLRLSLGKCMFMMKT